MQKYNLEENDDRFEVKNITPRKKAIDLTDYSFLPNSLVSMLTYFSMSIIDRSYIPIFSNTKLFLIDLQANDKLLFSRSAQET